jgi:ATP-binding cassette subfamily F protein 3
VANKIWFIEDMDIKEYPGTYAEYEEWNSKRVQPVATSIPVKQEKEVKPKVVEKTAPNSQQQLKKLNEQLRKTEEEIAAFEQSVKSIEAKIADETIYSNAHKLAEANKEYTTAKFLLDTAQKNWEDVASQIMELESK